MIKSAVYFFSVLMMINMVLIGFGLYDQSVDQLNQYKIISQTPEEVYDQDIPVTFSGDSNTSSDSDVSSTLFTKILSGIPETKKVYDRISAVQNLFSGWAFGWSAIFVILQIPMKVTYMLTNLIMLIQIVSVLYMIVFFIGGLLGGIR